MKGLDTSNLFQYKVCVEYKKGYFDNPSTPLIHEVNFFSTKERSEDHIKKTYSNSTVLKIELIKRPI